MSFSDQDLSSGPSSMRAEVIDGTTFASPRLSITYVDAVSELFSVLRHSSRGKWHILPGPELHLGGDVLTPNIAGWRVERVPMLPRTSTMTIAPDWVCETISVHNARLVRLHKRRVYRRAGVEHLWQLELELDVEQRVLELLQGHGDDWWWRVPEEEPLVRIPPFEEIEIDLTLIWGPPPA